MITHLFVYGTLRPGEVRWPFLEPFVDGEGDDDTASGALYDSGHGYPAARFDRPGLMHGRRYRLRIESIGEALGLLDEVEAAVELLFRRIAVRTVAGIEAWAYEYCDATDLPKIIHGDWLAESTGSERVDGALQSGEEIVGGIGFVE
jgi:gamma-glutamylcyclotransferase (GGCT)/AIG2-like uncharacterized protein YtfP